MPLDDETQVGGGTGNNNGTGNGDNTGNNGEDTDGRPKPINPPFGPLNPPKKEEGEGDD